MLRAFFARAALLLTLSVLVFGCSSGSKADGEGQVSSRSLALDAGPDAEPPDAGGDAAPTDGGGGDAAPACSIDADCGNGCGVCTAGVCSAAANTVVCRAAAGLCDVAETCDGVSTACPTLNAKQPATHVCRAANGTCDPEEKCDGTSNACPVNAFAATTVVCRAVTPGNTCDVEEKCDGAGSCPVDGFAASTVECRAGNGTCDPAEKCTGSGPVCPANAFAATTVQCRAVNGPCDVAETCDGAGACQSDVFASGNVCRAAIHPLCDIAEVCSGASAACPGDTFAPTSTACRPSVGICDAAESCDGAGHCPADGKFGSGIVCNAPIVGNDCDAPEVCDGVNNGCPADVNRPSGFVCRAAAVGKLCDVPESCTGLSKQCPSDGFRATGFVCRVSADLCDAPEACTGNADCPPDLPRPSSFVCHEKANPNDPTSCDVEETCDGVSFACPPDITKPSGSVCRPAIPQQPCDQEEVCNGASKACPVNGNKPAGSSCSDGFDCTETDKCDQGGRCLGTPNDNRCPNEDCAFVFCSATLGCQHTLSDTTKQCRPAAGSCDVPEFCDGQNGACPGDVRKPGTTVCQALSCANATVKPQILCDGASATCPAVADISCGNFACGSPTECRTTCITSDDCGPAFYCLNNDCIPRIGAGQPCASDAECSASNNHCVDKVCCDTTCTGQCEACNLPGKAGTCSGVTGKPVMPRELCVTDGTKCDGFCDPSNRTACQFPTKDTSCRDAACDPAANAAVAESFCTGKGTCALTTAMACQPYVCAGSACGGDCKADAQCAKDAYCQAGKCTAKAPLADACTSDKQCGSGHCADGVCCDSACTGQCEACSGVTGAKDGTCSAVSGSPIGKKPACAESDPACGGSCDGKNRLSCIYPGQGKVCRAGACADGKATAAASCDGQGACPAVTSVSCEKGCEGALCAGDECLADSDCESGKFCAAGVCTTKAAPGSACSTASACATGFCTDGVCCDSACLGQCEACDASGSVGTCSAAPKGDSPHGGRSACASDGSSCGGSCDGATRDRCKYPFDVVCRAGACTPGATADDPGIAVVEATCMGNGACPAEQQQLCGVNGCDNKNKQCDGACAADEKACKSGEYCAAGECVAQLDPGTACANDAQCGSKFCVDGVCCDTRCGDQCAACDVPGAVGTCTAVSGGVHGGRAACAGFGTCGAACDGEVVASCSLPDETVSCGEPFCSAGVKGAAPLCNGQGVCAPAVSTECKSFECEGSECSTKCVRDSDCTKERVCEKGECVGPTLIAAVDKGSCGCAVPGSRTRTPAGVLVLLGSLALFALRRRRAA